MFRRLFAITLFLACTGMAQPAGANDFAGRFALAEVRKPVPSFIFQDGQGRETDLKAFRGRYVLLNLWATWCAPCVREMPALDALQARFGKQRLSVIALTQDRDGLAVAKGFFNRYDIKNLGVYADGAGRAGSILGISGLPTTLLIDPQGREIGRVSGNAEWDAPDTIAFLEARMLKVATR
ncbi:MAG: TlpA disulfide reductase family protein [Alphaproteobacteria bacterium]|nr:TlpA disulfide reductase family protein [Alphaproteobacteria bacterium]